MEPQNIIFQLFGQAGIDAIDDVDFDGCQLGEFTYNGVAYIAVAVDYSDGTVTFFDASGVEALKLAIKVELVPITK